MIGEDTEHCLTSNVLTTVIYDQEKSLRYVIFMLLVIYEKL